jgi:hypothetical protein
MSKAVWLISGAGGHDFKFASVNSGGVGQISAPVVIQVT